LFINSDQKITFPIGKEVVIRFFKRKMPLISLSQSYKFDDPDKYEQFIDYISEECADIVDGTATGTMTSKQARDEFLLMNKKCIDE
jgi:hypothetical protein